MIQLFDILQNPFVNNDAILPPVGEYYALITNFNTSISFMGDIQYTILKIDYLLMSLDEHDVYKFTETYTPSYDNPRFEKLYSYLKQHFAEDEIDCINEDTLNFTVEKVTIDLDYLGGQAYPIITHRELISRQPAEEITEHNTVISLDNI